MARPCPFKRSGGAGYYTVATTVHEHEILFIAKKIIGRRFRRGTVIKSPKEMKEYLIVHLAPLDHEVFVVVYLDSTHAVITVERLFRGTVDSTSVYPREVVKSALANNASAVIFAHNHPSGTEQPSLADRTITQRLVQALGLVDIRVLEHFIVAGTQFVSFAEKGLL